MAKGRNNAFTGKSMKSGKPLVVGGKKSASSASAASMKKGASGSGKAVRGKGSY